MDEARKKAIKLQHRRAERQAFVRSLPMAGAILQQLLDEVDEAVGQLGCDHSFQLLEAAAQSGGLETIKLISWLREQGSFCDCEAGNNVRGRLEDALKEAPGPRTQ